MNLFLALLLRLMRRARFVFVALYLVVSAGFLYADHRAGWTWFIVVAGASLCLLFWGLVAFLTQVLTRKHVFTRKPTRDGEGGSDHG